MKKWIFLISIFITIFCYSQGYKDQRGPIRMLYGGDTLIIAFSGDTNDFSGSLDFYKKHGALIIDSLKFAGSETWVKSFVNPSSSVDLSLSPAGSVLIEMNDTIGWYSGLVSVNGRIFSLGIISTSTTGNVIETDSDTNWIKNTNSIGANILEATGVGGSNILKAKNTNEFWANDTIRAVINSGGLFIDSINARTVNIHMNDSVIFHAGTNLTSAIEFDSIKINDSIKIKNTWFTEDDVDYKKNIGFGLQNIDNKITIGNYVSGWDYRAIMLYDSIFAIRGDSDSRGIDVKFEEYEINLGLQNYDRAMCYSINLDTNRYQLDLSGGGAESLTVEADSDGMYWRYSADTVLKVNEFGVDYDGALQCDTITITDVQVLADDSVHFLDAITDAVIVPIRCVVKKTGGYYDQPSHIFLRSFKEDGMTQQDIGIIYECDDIGWNGTHIIFNTYSTAQSQFVWTTSYQGGVNKPIWIQCEHHSQTTLTGDNTKFEIRFYYTIAKF